LFALQYFLFPAYSIVFILNFMETAETCQPRFHPRDVPLSLACLS
jgi:hypothetical protein